MEGNRAGRAWGLSMVVAVASLSGCVMNPYIRSSSVPVKPDSSTLCSGWSDSAVGEADALKYATCLRRVMEDKASRHAMMNNGGGPLLLGIAGLAAYRGFQGGHEANIAALTMGGAALYGAQQYLYRAPRESIYLAGAGALACAISQTQRKSEVSRNLDGAELLAASELREIDRTIFNLNRFGSNSMPPKQCPEAQLFAEAEADAERADDISRSLSRRLVLAKPRLAQLRAAATNANFDLIATTDAIVATINQQLVLQQPNPADLATLLAKLKLPGTPSVPDDKNVQIVSAPIAPAPEQGSGEEESMMTEDGLACRGYEAKIQSYAAQIASLEEDVDRATVTLDELEKKLDTEEVRIGTTNTKDESMRLCYQPLAMSLLPFSLVLAQPGAQSLGTSALLIPISGGAPPFSVVAVEGPTQVKGAAESDGIGGYRFKLERGTNPTAGLHNLIATDNAGVTRIFQVEIK